MAFGIIQAGMKATAILINSIAPLAQVKQSDQSKFNNTLVNDNALFVTLTVNAQYLFVCYLNYEGGTLNTSDLQWTWSLPAGATVRYACLNHDLTNALQFETRLGSGTIAAGSNGAGNLRAVLMAGTVFMANNPGNMQLQWAQNTTNATGTIVHAQSFLALWRTS